LFGVGRVSGLLVGVVCCLWLLLLLLLLLLLFLLLLLLLLLLIFLAGFIVADEAIVYSVNRSLFNTLI